MGSLTGPMATYGYVTYIRFEEYIFPGSPRTLKEWSHGIVDYKPLLKRGDGARKRPCVFDDVSTLLFAGFAKNPCVLQFILLEM